MRRILPLACTSLLLSSTFLTPAFAQEANEQPSVSLDAITVYATRTPQSSFEVPASTSSIDTEAPGNALAGDTSDLLKYTPGVEVANGPRRNGQTVSIRGFDNDAIITLMDGRRQNFEAAHDGRFYIDPSLLKRVEVVRGASSAVYGGGGIGGVLAFDTKDAADMLAPGDDFGVYSAMGYRSGNEEYAPVVSAFGRTGAFDVIGIASYRNAGNIRQGGGSELQTDDELLSGLFKVGYNFNDFNNLKFIYQGLRNDGSEPNNGGGAVTTSNPIVQKKVTDNQFGLKYEFENPANDWLKPKLHVYYNNTDVRETDISGSNTGRVQVREIETIGFNADNQTILNVNENQKHTLSYGFEIYHDEQTGSTTNGGTRPGVPNADATNYGVYVQNEFDWRTDYGRFLIIPAARFDSYRSSDDAGNSQDESQVSPKFSVSYMPNDNFMVYGSYAQAFRAPNLTELYSSGQHFPAVPPMFPANFFTPNPNLKPETVTTYEIGAGFDFAGIPGPHDRAYMKGSWFLSYGDDFITQNVDIFGGTTTMTNVPEARLSGFEIEALYQINPVTAKLGLSYVEAEDETTGAYLDNNVPMTLVADLSYDATSIESIFGVRGRFATENDKNSTGVATSGYSVFDLYYRWMPSMKPLDTLTVDFGVSNIFDKEYTTAYSGLYEEGRSVNVRVAYQW
ncbi:MAG: hypothetical protein CMN55_02295 [Sneathiella sp.]|jgi:hemoglobin/transferrin/lactoferrin receptor protein|uniref:TonB-dependent hemoglobin/transferrin/lactoferrin family receptor n=1 Tax=Sneathiella sp. TaxID=1964365 RepID=UPI000C37B680|nr:TonB-dependent hemoglobin/transferrin/lactoferrin family receptor [Sneathiella sp.]MAL77935.1 hypothetical protein [Sneathiella sp.]